jgi:EAL domain-containing protein (putative c-di-GMP-specific phosphodiesterase class I)
MVDSKEALEFVRDCGVEYVQGFLFGKPDPDPWAFLKKLDRKLFA